MTTKKPISEKVIQFDSSATPSQINVEQIDFDGNWDSLKGDVSASYKLHIPPCDEVQMEPVLLGQIFMKEKESSQHFYSCKDCAVCRFLFLKRYNMYSLELLSHIVYIRSDIRMPQGT